MRDLYIYVLVNDGITPDILDVIWFSFNAQLQRGPVLEDTLALLAS